MTVTVYRFDDASAPDLVGTNGGLITVLDACLVNGYGSKAAAGWTKPYSGTNTAAYRMGTTNSTGFYLRVDNNMSSGHANVRGYEAMTGIDTGTNPFPTAAQNTYGVSVCVSSGANATARPWMLFADDRRFILWVATSQTEATGLSAYTSTAYCNWAYFGDFKSLGTGDSYNCQLIGHAAGAVGNNYSSGGFLSYINASAITGHYLARSYDGVSLSVNNQKAATNNAQSAGSGINSVSYHPAYPHPVTGGVHIQPMYVTDSVGGGAALRGTLPGLWFINARMPGANGDTFSGTGAISSKTFILLDENGPVGFGRLAVETSNTWDI